MLSLHNRETIIIYLSKLSFLTMLGEECQAQFATCSCEPLVLPLARARLWPSSPQHPHFTFAFELLDWTEVLLLEAQASLNDLYKALYFKCSNIMTKVVVVFYVQYTSK